MFSESRVRGEKMKQVGRGLEQTQIMVPLNTKLKYNSMSLLAT